MIKPATISANTHIDNLKSQLREANSKQLDYLLLVHPDMRMIGQLQKAFENSSIAIIALPQNCWTMDDESVSELVGWALNETSAKRIMLVGHSQGGTPSEAVQVCPSGQVDPAGFQPVNRVGSLMDRVKNAQACVRRNEEHFASELRSLRDQVCLRSDRVANPDVVQGLFYRAESGVFCAYDSDAEQFQALISETELI